MAFRVSPCAYTHTHTYLALVFTKLVKSCLTAFKSRGIHSKTCEYLKAPSCLPVEVCIFVVKYRLFHYKSFLFFPYVDFLKATWVGQVKSAVNYVSGQKRHHQTLHEGRVWASG